MRDLPFALDALIRRVLAKSPSDRFPDAPAFDRALADILDEAPVPDRPRDDAPPLFTCPKGQQSADAARSALAAWTCFDHPRAQRYAAAAARLDPAWSPLRLLLDHLDG